MFLGEQPAYIVAGKPLAPAEVKDSGRALCEQFPHCFRGDISTGRAAIFIDEQVERLSVAPGPLHFLIETTVAAGRDAAVEGNAKDGMAWIAGDQFFRGDFGFGVNRKWVGEVRFDVIPLLAIKDQIGGEKDKGNGGGELGEVHRGLSVHQAGGGGVGFASGVARHGSAMNDGGGAFLVEEVVHRGKVRQVPISAAERANDPGL